ncbi:MAG: hypothetical protein L0H74_10305 [Brachybacterium sp.]|nr:hypothetical protein [Brachybacterium sp.]
MAVNHGVEATPGDGAAGERLARTRRMATWGALVTSGLATVGLALPTRRMAWFHGELRTDDITVESWANPATIDIGNLLTLLPMQAFLTALATTVLAVLALHRPVLAGVGVATGLVSAFSMLLSWVLLAAFDPVATPALMLLAAAETALLIVAVLRLVEVRQARADSRA